MPGLTVETAEWIFAKPYRKFVLVLLSYIFLLAKVSLKDPHFLLRDYNS